MKKTITTILVAFAMICSAFAKETTWGTGARWNNNHPEVVATMPGVQSCVEANGFDSFKLVEREVSDEIKTAVREYADGIAAEEKDLGQFIYILYDDEPTSLGGDASSLKSVTKGIIIICNYEVSKRGKNKGENVFVDWFVYGIDLESKVTDVATAKALMLKLAPNTTEAQVDQLCKMYF